MSYFHVMCILSCHTFIMSYLHVILRRLASGFLLKCFKLVLKTLNVKCFICQNSIQLTMSSSVFVERSLCESCVVLHLHLYSLSFVIGHRSEFNLIISIRPHVVHFDKVIIMIEQNCAKISIYF